ncbi:sensor histidine kinase [Sediminivirga luteola]|uniref:Sensor-like histidine kinase SenX3 n=1 Tax=Sediminivirga luteola TaxID=1774748 RepID=A0A8J2XKI8_9MICO|nr:ATP-binding protein [Sediminivirga luteola]MCI2265864.1 ATP-binding protein [Sediminivirga luteola]GGA13986.1 two-component sensor histidine kinase [Sediminivirga luteola]
MDIVLVAVVSGAIGLSLGLVAVYALRMSARNRMSDDMHSEHELPEGISEVLAVLSPAAIVVDAGDDVVKASPAAYTFGLIKGNGLASEELQRTVARVRSRGLIQELELEQPRGPRSPGRRYLRARVAPLGPAYVLVLCEDLTEARHLEEVRRDFVANVSHELKTPIGAIGLLAEAVSDSADDPEAVQRFAARLERESGRLSQLIQEIIDLSRVQNHEKHEQEALIDVRDIVGEAADRARIAAEAKNIRISIAAERPAWVYGNRDLLVQAVRNLIDNAINYSGADTQVGVGIRVVDDTVAIAVKDEGIGLSKADAARVFERFYRVDPARSRMTGGTGLGLSIVKHVVATHGGEVRVWSQLGHGSTFTIELPAAETDEDSEDATDAGAVRPEADPAAQGPEEPETLSGDAASGASGVPGPDEREGRLTR